MDDESRAHFEALRHELGAVRDSLSRRFDEEALATRRHFEVVAEHLEDRIRAVAEGVAVNEETLLRFRSELDARLTARDAVVDAAFAAIRGDIGTLRRPSRRR